jgi:ABC-type branched-subunit amino acid transport system permease subunit
VIAHPTIDVPAREDGLRGFLGVRPAMLLGLGAVLAFPRFFSTTWVFTVMVGMVLAISCLGLLVVVGWLREISLMQAGLTGSALYLLDYAYRPQSDMGHTRQFPLAAAFAITFVVVLSFLVALVSARLAGAYVIVLTLSVQFTLESTIFLQYRFVGGLSAGTVPRPNLFGLSMRPDAHYYYFVLGVLTVTVVFLYRLRHSRFGRSMILVGSDPQAAAAAGISPWKYKVVAFCIAGFCAGLAGVVSGPMYYTAPWTGQYISFNSLFYLAIPVLAGFDSLAAVVGLAVLCTVLPQVLLEWRVNVYLLGGVGVALGVFLGPRGVGGGIADLLDGRWWRYTRRELDARGSGEPPADPELIACGTVDL